MPLSQMAVTLRLCGAMASCGCLREHPSFQEQPERTLDQKSSDERGAGLRPVTQPGVWLHLWAALETCGCVCVGRVPAIVGAPGI